MKIQELVITFLSTFYHSHFPGSSLVGPETSPPSAMAFLSPSLPQPRGKKPTKRRRALTLTTLQPRRSKMILTRRIHTWTLKPPLNTNISHPSPPSSGSPNHATRTRTRTRTHTHQTYPGFIFQRPASYAPKRRPADPPSRYLQLSPGQISVIPNTTLERWNLSQTSRRANLRLTRDMLFRPPKHSPPQPNFTPRSPLPLYGELSKLYDRIPRVIVIGDVHGCIAELQALLRLANYTSGDQVVFLGDLIAKGPDSVGVVQLAKEIGARAVRGNHDYEVVRWFEARRRGIRNDVSVEHARIARSLSSSEHAWLMDCPWFIESPEMNHLFVHAGFIPGVKLTQQNPRLMMNMRSVLKDGTVTARNVVGCEWGRLWQGPQTVVFGHDAYRGLQRYDYAVGLDTGCVYGGRLTALLLPENRLLSVAAKRAYISPRRFRPAKENATPNAATPGG